MLKILTTPFKGEIKNPPITFDFLLDDFQLHSFNAIMKGENVLITAHTGSGKTVPAIFAIAHFVSMGKKVVYTSPIKTLSNQKYNELRELFELSTERRSTIEDCKLEKPSVFLSESAKQLEELSTETSNKSINCTIGLMTGDNKINPDADCVVMTTEILRNALYDINKDQYFKDDFISSIGCVIFDEVHYINDSNRGHVWEETITLLDPSITLVMLSATIDKANEFGQWIADIKQKPMNLIPTNKRVVPLEHFIFVNNYLYKIQDKNNKFDDNSFDTAYKNYKLLEKSRNINKIYMINEMVKYLKQHDMLQTIFFSFSRNNCEKYALSIQNSLLTIEESKSVIDLFDKYMRKYDACYSSLKQYQLIKDLAIKGVSFHHSGLIPILKEIVEILFQNSLIKVLFATETFAVGVNMPTRSIVFTELEKYTESGLRMLHPAEYKQMSGRAGRRGIDTIGYVIILPLHDIHYKHELKSIMLGKPPFIESKFSINYSFVLKILQSNSKNITEFINSSLFNRDILSKINNDVKLLEQLKANNTINITNKYTPDTLIKLEKYTKFLELEEGYKKMGITLNKKEQREKAILTKELAGNKNLNKLYKEYIDDKNISAQITDLEDSIYSNQQYTVDQSEKIIKLLTHFNYIENINSDIIKYNSDIIKYNSNIIKYNSNIIKYNILIKGVIAGQINECNPLLFTEMIIQNMFDDLDSLEIVALLSIFIDDNHNNDNNNNNYHSIKCSEKVVQKIKQVNSICEQYINIEKQLDIDIHHYGFWDIYYDYVDVSYIWANNGSIDDVFNCIDTYEGNFIRCMLKLNNIVHDLITLSHIAGNIQIIPKLEVIESSIIRGIVTVNSLYL